MSIAVPSDETRSQESALPNAEGPTCALSQDIPVTVIRRRPGWQLVDLTDLWAYRELGFFLTWRDIKVRYKQTVLGAAWAVIQPLATMIIFTLFLGPIAREVDSPVPYPLFVFSGLLAWTFLSTAVTSAGQSVVNNQALVTKVFFPRLLIPISSVGAGAVDLAIGFVLLLAGMLICGFVPGWSILVVPLIFGLLVLTAIGVGALLSALTVTYRDFRYVVPFMVQAWMFATPSIYLQATETLGATSRALLPFNPAYGLIAGLRASILGTTVEPGAVIISAAVGLAIFAVGCIYFRVVERRFADVI